MLCKIVQFGFFVWGPRHSVPPPHVAGGLGARIKSFGSVRRSSARVTHRSCPADANRDGNMPALPSWRDTGATRSLLLRYSRSCRPFALRRKRRRLLRRAKSEVESVVVSATRFDIPLDQSPASVSVISVGGVSSKNRFERVSDALREVPGLSVVQTGVAGQLTSVFTRGLRSEHTQVLIDGVPINQGLQGAFNFADLTTDDIDRIEVVRGPQSTLYGPRALAGVIQIFTKQGEGPPGIQSSAEGGSYDTFREWLQSDGKIGQFDYSVGASRLDTDNARPNNQYRNSAAIANLGWSPNDQLRISGLFTYSLSDIGLAEHDFRSAADRQFSDRALADCATC